MGFLGWIILGLAVGAITKSLLPGRIRDGLLLQLGLGVGGALVGGWLGAQFFGIGLGSFWNIKTWALAIGGALIVTLVYSFFSRQKKR